MIKLVFRNILRLLLVLAVAYAGSFMVMEESFEKTEKTEKSEEALKSAHFSKHTKKDVASSEENGSAFSMVVYDPNLKSLPIACPTLFNVHHIYYTSYLDMHLG